MKKIMFLLLIGCLVVASTCIFAAGPPYRYEGNLIRGGGYYSGVYDEVDLSATVLPYASVRFNGDQTALTLSGAAGSEAFGQVTYTTETNCDVYGDGFGTEFVGVKYTEDRLDTWYWIYNPQDANAQGWTKAPLQNYDATDVQACQKVITTLKYKAQCGAISAQHAQDYTAKYTIYVYAPY